MRLALFDFDGTLTRRDTLLPFLRYTFGTRRFALGMTVMSPTLGAYALRLMRNDRAKERVLTHFLEGISISELRQEGVGFAHHAISGMLRPDMMKTLAQHRDRGDTCLLVSASLSVYLEPWAQAHGFSAALCSHLETNTDGSITGRLENGNCFGIAKVRRVQEWLSGRKPEHVTAYGDSRGDAEMLAYADEPRWIHH